MIARILDRPFRRAGFFDLGAHGTQIVADRNNREEQNQTAMQDKNATQRPEPLTPSAMKRTALPYQVGWQCQYQPDQIEYEFHGFSDQSLGGSTATACHAGMHTKTKSEFVDSDIGTIVHVQARNATGFDYLGELAQNQRISVERDISLPFELGRRLVQRALRALACSQRTSS